MESWLGSLEDRVDMPYGHARALRGGAHTIMPYGHFFKLDYDCPNCGEDFWHRDVSPDLRAARLRRYVCFHCKYDMYPGNYIQRTLDEETPIGNRRTS